MDSKNFNMISQDLAFEILSDINSASPFPDDSFSKSPFNSEPKMVMNSNSTIEKPFKEIIRRMQDEIDTLLHENAELKSRQSIDSSCCSCQNNKGQHEKHERDTKSTDDSKTEDFYGNDQVHALRMSLKEKDGLIDSLSSKVNELWERIKIMDKENKAFRSEIKKRENYLQQKLQLEIDMKQAIRSNQELQTKFDALETQINLKALNQNSFSQENNSMDKNETADIEQEKDKKKIFKLSKENNISKDVNQTLVKLLKLKNLQIQTNKILEIEDQKDHERARSNLEKFENEEKKLLKILETVMKKYQGIDDHL